MTEEEWLSCTDPAAVYEAIYRQKRPSRRRHGEFFHEAGIDWNKNAFEIFAAKRETAEAETLAVLLRCFFGNPFRPVAVDPAWLTETVVALAEGIYQEWAFDRLPVLADALEEAGCDSDNILTHCRQPGEHVRGCWVIDLLTGRK
jgi:hypothetical protein